MAQHIIGLAGEMVSGKSTVAKYLIAKYSATTYKFSEPIRDVLDRLSIEQTRENLGLLSTVLRKTYGEDLFAKILFEDAQKSKNAVVVVDGVRRLADIAYLQKLPEFKLVYVKSSLEARYHRVTRRSENVDDQGKTFEQFQKEQLQESEAEIRDLEPHASVIIENEGTLEDLFKKVDQMMKA